MKQNGIWNSSSLVLLLSLTFIFGCATSGSHQGTAENDLSKNESISDSFTRGYYGVVLNQVDKSECRFSESKSNQLSWKEKVQTANACVADGNWQKVELLGSMLAESEPRAPWGAYFLGLAAEGRNDLDRASWMNEQALKRAPTFGLLHYQKGRINWKRQEHSSAMESLLKSIQIDPNLIDAHLFLGQIFFRDQDFGKAARHFQAVLRARPKDPTALIGLAECQIQLGDASGALELLKRGQKHHADDPLFLLREAHVQETMLNDIPRAIEIYHEVLKYYQSGSFKRELDFNLEQKITELEISVRGNRSLAGSRKNEVTK